MSGGQIGRSGGCKRPPPTSAGTSLYPCNGLYNVPYERRDLKGYAVSLQVKKVPACKSVGGACAIGCGSCIDLEGREGNRQEDCMIKGPHLNLCRVPDS